jgi:hypothetical protein
MDIHTFHSYFPILAKLGRSGLHVTLSIICKFRDNWRSKGHMFLRACTKLHLGTRVPGTPLVRSMYDVTECTVLCLVYIHTKITTGPEKQ